MEEDSIWIVSPALWSQGRKGTTQGRKEGRREASASTWNCPEHGTEEEYGTTVGTI